MRKVADLEERVVGVTRRIPLEDPTATNRLIRWIYDGWRGEIGSWPRVNLARVKAGEGFQGRSWGKRTTPDRFPTGFMPLFFIRFAPKTTYTLRHGTGRYYLSRRAVFQLASSFHCAFGTWLVYSTISTRQRAASKVLIISLRWLREIGHACVQFRKEILHPFEILNAWIKKYCWTLSICSRGFCAQSALTEHRISNVSVLTGQRLMQLTFVHKIAWVFNVILMLRASFPLKYRSCHPVVRHFVAHVNRENLSLYSPRCSIVDIAVLLQEY